jgi:hypothetical protein
MPPVEDDRDGRPLTDDPYKVSAPEPATDLLPVGFASNPATAAANNAEDEAPLQVAENRSITPPPWPATEEREERRTHVVVDGDSLERLADRYLHDPRRGAEIFELNREILSQPDLLPIGAELRIPDCTSRLTQDHQSRRTWPLDGASVREAASGNLVPVRPVSSGEEIIPRAQLSRPLPMN